METVVFLNPVFNDGVLFCDENVLFFFSLGAVIAGIVICFRSFRSFRLCFCAVLTCIFGYAVAKTAPGLYPMTRETVVEKLLLAFVLFFVMLWIYVRLSWLLSGWLASVLRLQKANDSKPWKIIGISVFGSVVALFFANRILLIDTHLDLLIGLFLSFGGIVFQNWMVNQKLPDYPTYGSLLQKTASLKPEQLLLNQMGGSFKGGQTAEQKSAAGFCSYPEDESFESLQDNVQGEKGSKEAGTMHDQSDFAKKKQEGKVTGESMDTLSRSVPSTVSSAVSSSTSSKKRVRLRLVFLTALFFSGLYITWRILFTIPLLSDPLAFTLGVLLLLVELIGLFEFMVNFSIMAAKKDYPLPKVTDERLYPDVDVFIATYNESETLLYKTINGCRHMDYPDPEKVHIYLCDDGRRPDVQKLANDMGVGYLSRENNEGAKAGNLNNALAHTSSPLVVTFDADMIPHSSFLMKTVPYFIDAELRNASLPEKQRAPLGFLQTPQTFYNWGLFQYHLYAEQDVANEQDYFYREIEVAKTASNSVIYGGSNTVLSRKALEAIGGFYTKAITEDFATGMLMEQAGFVSLAIAEPLAAGLAPEDLPGLIQQRIRWGRGVVNVLYQINLFFTDRFSLAQKLSYWTSIQYWMAPFARLLFVFIPIVSGLFGISVVRTPLWAALLFWMPMMLANSWAIRRLSGKIRTSIWTNLYETIMFPFLVGPIFLEFLGISLKTFKVTEKGVEKPKHFRWRYVGPFVFMLALTILSLAVILHDMTEHRIFGGSITLFWLAYNGLLLFVAILFFAGRKEGSLASLQHAAVYGVLESGGKAYEGAVSGLNEREVEVIFNEKPAFRPGSMGDLLLDYEGKVLHLPVKADDLSVIRNLPIGRFEILNAGNSGQKESREDYDAFLHLVFNRQVPTVYSAPTWLFLPLVLRRFQDRIRLHRKKAGR